MNKVGTRGLAGRGPKALALGLCLGALACAASHDEGRDPLMDVPIDPLRGTSSIVIHRPLPVGTRLHVQGVYKKYHRTTGKNTGWVVAQDVDQVQLGYDLTKTFVDVDLDGDPKRVRYDVAEIASNDLDAPQFTELGERRSTLLHSPEMDRMQVSGGQQFDFFYGQGKYTILMHAGSLRPIEEAVFKDLFGPFYEFRLERMLAHMFAPKGPKRIGDHWDVDLDDARLILERMGELTEAAHVSGQATFMGTERVFGIPVQRIEAWIKGEGKLRHEVTYPIQANHNLVELKYVGIFPVDLNLPAISHDWSLKGKGQLVVEHGDDLADIHFDTLCEHQSKVIEVRR